MGIALLAALSQAGGILIDKFILAKKRMSLAHYISILFVFLFITTLVTLPWLGQINSILVFNRAYLFYFLLMIILAIIWNIFYYQGLRKEKMIEFEMIMMLTPLATILLATVFFPEEFNLPVFIAALVGCMALFISHLRKYHFRFDKYSINLLLAVVLMAMESMVMRELLSVYSPAALYAFRTAALALFFAAYYRPNLHEVDNEAFRLTFLSAIFGTVFMITRLYGYQSIGLTFTTLILLLTPIITTWVDAMINHTPIKRRTVFAFALILAAVAYATYYAST